MLNKERLNLRWGNGVYLHHSYTVVFFFRIYFNWRIITVQYCDGFFHLSVWIGHRYTCGPSILNAPRPQSTSLPYPPLGCHRAPVLGALLLASNSHWLSLVHITMYMFECYSLKSSHLLLFPLSPKVCSLHLGLLCCPLCRIVGTIFLDSIYMH